MSSDSLADYYARRAHEYERVYAKPERQQDLRWLAARLGALLGGRDVLEVACGTGYWTQVLVRHARSVVACDINDEVLKIARGKPWGAAEVRFCRHDAFDVAEVPGRFDAGFAGFWWSHIQRARLAGFLDQWHRRVGQGGLLVAIDNRYVSGSSTPITRTDAEGNTYQLRRLVDGSRHEVLKNFPDAHQLLAILARLQPPVVDARVELTRYFWCLSYRLADLAASAGVGGVQASSLAGRCGLPGLTWVGKSLACPDHRTGPPHLRQQLGEGRGDTVRGYEALPHSGPNLTWSSACEISLGARPQTANAL
jgi:SAM-dependent methyltransferase